MNKLKSRKFWLTVLAHAGSAYLVSQGHATEAAAFSAVVQGTYNIGQGMADSGSAKDELIKMAVDKAVSEFASK